MRPFLLAGVLFSSLIAVDVAAQILPEPIFSDINSAAATQAATPAASAIVARRIVDMRLDRLFTSGSGRVLLNVGAHNWVARFDRLDGNVLGHRSWVGTIEGIDNSNVSFAERNGIVSGVIDGLSDTYQIQTIRPGMYALERVDTSRLRSELEPLVDAAADSAAAPANASTASDDGSVIDVLLLYTPNARVRRGGDAQIQALTAQIISDSNTAFLRSGIAARFRLIGASEVAITESASMSTDLSAFRANAIVRNLRDALRADLVQLLVSSPDTSACGVGYLLQSLTNTNFDAYSVADVDCAVQYTPTHEMGHNMGSHHAPEDLPSSALFPYSYGFKDAARAFRTIMAYACSPGSCPRVLNLSNPAVTQNGGATGTANQNNALSINNAANTVANFRQAQTPPPITPPSAPTGLLSQVTGTTVRLSWNAVTTDGTWLPSAATSYTLQVGTAASLSNVFLASVGNLTTVSGTAPPGTYYWRVVAVNSAGPSPVSAEANFTVGAACTPPGAPQNFTFSLAARTVTLSWGAAAAGGAATTYIVEVGSATGLANLLTFPTGSTATTLTAQAPPGAFYVRIRAQNACGTSAPSGERVIVVP